jgi:hypothetical protein
MKFILTREQAKAARAWPSPAVKATVALLTLLAWLVPAASRPRKTGAVVARVLKRKSQTEDHANRKETYDSRKSIPLQT